MCGIVGYVGEKDAAGVLLDGLKNLEYRGYDSAGISVFENGLLKTVKAQGRLAELEEKLAQNGTPSGGCGIGHTRWATHGAPSDTNAHPHFGMTVCLVHNGIIENYMQLRAYLADKGYKFYSQTDTEVAAKLIDSLYDGDPYFAIKGAIKMIKGSYAFGILFSDRPGVLYAARKDSPLIAAVGEAENFIASDMPAILEYTRDYYLIEENEIVTVTGDAIKITDLQGNEIKKPLFTADWSIEQAQKGGFEHFMLKEIYEQPAVLHQTVSPRIADGLPCFAYDGLPAHFFRDITKIHMVACGTAMHTGLVGRRVMEELARLQTDVALASEFRYSNPILTKEHLVIIVSQSGETADSLAALRLAKGLGVPTLAIVNVAGSSIAREADYVIYTHAGPEISVASTKAYSVQLAVMYLIAIQAALDKAAIGQVRARALVAGLLRAVALTGECLELDEQAAALAPQYRETQSLFFIGRGLDYALAQEGSLKMKEISYIHCEAYAAGELKHGTISLITQDVPVIALLTQGATLPKTTSNIREVRTRGARVLLLVRRGLEFDPELCDSVIELPDAEDLFMPLLAIIPLQLLAYHTARERGCDVDKPRNLAKSVTVE